jgi:hypothetical protein
VAGRVDDTVVEVVVTWTGDSLGFCRPKMAAVVAAPTTADVPATMARVSFDMFAAGADMRESTSRPPADARFMSAVICLTLSAIRERYLVRCHLVLVILRAVSNSGEEHAPNCARRVANQWSTCTTSHTGTVEIHESLHHNTKRSQCIAHEGAAKTSRPEISPSSLKSCTHRTMVGLLYRPHIAAARLDDHARSRRNLPSPWRIPESQAACRPCEIQKAIGCIAIMSHGCATFGVQAALTASTWVLLAD